MSFSCFFYYIRHSNFEKMNKINDPKHIPIKMSYTSTNYSPNLVKDPPVLGKISKLLTNFL